ncbi:chromatin assembly factor 1 subunit A-domain-containing protein [Aspergillus cavernicola]|uniref:Chromatin assembly factor 1 subunit A-domain-containing protein n=1 Tax=Aspergillus cavernicola TaxID=176166 RepID=A0ABR4IGB5_9EURO
MEVSMATDVISEPSTSIQSSAAPSSLSPLPTTHAQPSAQTQTQLQLSPGQKRPAHEVDSPSTPIQSDRKDSTPSASAYRDDKENRGDPLGFKDVGNPSNMTTAATTSWSISIPTGVENLHSPSVNMGQHSQPGDAGAGAGTLPATKKRKLSPTSRDAKQQDKEAKERQKLEEKTKKDEEKAKKEEEKAKKDEEKRQRDAEKEEERKKREEKKKAKEEEKVAKDEEKRKKEEERLKKARAQPKLSSFFAKPMPTTNQSPLIVSSSPKKPSNDGASADTSGDAGGISAYKQTFPDFFLQSNTRLAPPHRFQRDAQALTHLQAKVDSQLTSPHAKSATPLVFRPSELFKMMPYKRRRGQQNMSVRDILLQMQSFQDIPETSKAARKLKDSLKQVRMKSLRFGEDVRPPYQGTFTKHLPQETVSRLMRNPFRREIPEVNYDYDSEAEWEEPEEGEELDSEEEEEGSEEGDDDMEEFLDDEEDQLGGKRRLLVGDLEPVSTGIRWQGQGLDPELQMYKLETILPSVTFPIDPFSSSYWQKPKVPEPAQNKRTTWHHFLGNPALGSLTVQDGSTVAAGKPKRAFPVEQLGEFKTVVEGSNVSKIGLIEILKKRFPKVSKHTLKATLDSTAKRVGQKEAEKKWVCI